MCIYCQTFVNDESAKVEQLLRHQVEDMKVYYCHKPLILHFFPQYLQCQSFVNDENEKIQRKNDELLCEVEHLKVW